MGPIAIARRRWRAISTKPVENSAKRGRKGTRNPSKPDGLVSDCGMETQHKTFLTLAGVRLG